MSLKISPEQEFNNNKVALIPSYRKYTDMGGVERYKTA